MRFEILAVIAMTDEAREVFRGYIKGCTPKGCPSALEKLPAGAIKGDEITVVRGEGSGWTRLWRLVRGAINLLVLVVGLIASIVTVLAFLGIRSNIRRRRYARDGEGRSER